MGVDLEIGDRSALQLNKVAFNFVGWDVDLEIGDSSALQLNEVGREFGNRR